MQNDPLDILGVVAEGRQDTPRADVAPTPTEDRDVEVLDGEIVEDGTAGQQTEDAPAARDHALLPTVLDTNGEMWVPGTVEISSALPDVELFGTLAYVDEAITLLKDGRERLSAEVLRRMDRRGRWTLRAGEPTDAAQFEVEADTPQGSERYTPDAVDAALHEAISDDRLDEEAGHEALKRTVTLTLRIPFGVDVNQVADRALENATVQIGDAEFQVLDAKGATQVLVPGVRRLRKIPELDQTLGAAELERLPPNRKVKANIKTRAS